MDATGHYSCHLRKADDEEPKNVRGSALNTKQSLLPVLFWGPSERQIALWGVTKGSGTNSTKKYSSSDCFFESCVFFHLPSGSGDVQGWVGALRKVFLSFANSRPFVHSLPFTKPTIHTKMNAVTKAFSTAKATACKLTGNNNDNNNLVGGATDRL